MNLKRNKDGERTGGYDTEKRLEKLGLLLGETGRIEGTNGWLSPDI